MTVRFPTIGCLGVVLSVATCASGGATSEVRPEEGLGDAASESLIPRRTCAPANTTAAPASGLIADFSAKQEGGSGAMSGDIPGKLVSSVPPDAVPGATATSTVDGGRLTINVKAPLGAKPQVFSTSLFFDRCVDASGFSGVELVISGSLSGCSLTYASVDPEHQYYRAGGPYPPQKRISPEELTPEPRKIVAPFRNADTPGNPATPTDPGKLAFLQWLVIAPVAADDGSAPPCTGSIVIDDVKLYR
jgi:hypothetical protein